MIDVSVLVVVHDVPQQAARSLFSLSAEYQRHIDPAAFEIIVVDNGSDPPLDPDIVAALAGNFRIIRIDPAPPSPAHAINRGLAEARGEVIGVMIDGARIATPGLLHFARHGARLYENAVVASLGWYLGHDLQSWAVALGYDGAREEALLGSIAWPSDGYRLFEIGTMDESSLDGWFQPISESCAVFARRAVWDAIEGFDERFDEPGGGLLNLDTFTRLLDVPDANLVMLLGEATFHQVHGGVSTNAPPTRQSENFARWAAQYAAVRGHPYEMPVQTKPRTYLGTLPQSALARLARAAIHPVRGDMAPPLGSDFNTVLWGRPDHELPADPVVARLVDLGRTKFAAGQAEASSAVARLLRQRAPAERGLEEILALVAGSVPSDVPPASAYAEYHQALGESLEILGERDAAAIHYRTALASFGNLSRAHLGLARLRMPGDDYLHWLGRLYAAIAPESVIEIGVYEGASLALLRPPTVAIAVDPNATVLTPLQTEAHIFTETSDEFFARGRARSVLGERPISAGFIDGLHLFEQALRDFINLEALCGTGSVIFIHDTVPLDEATATRTQGTAFYTGDVWKLVMCLAKYRPDLDVFTIAAAPTGLTVVCGLDPASRVLENAYDEAVARFIEMPLSAAGDDLDRALNLVANDWDIVHSRLAERGIL